MFPLQSALLPGETLPLRIFEPRYSALVADCLRAAEPSFGVVLISRGREVGGGDSRCEVGALARIVEHTDLGAGRYRLHCAMSERIRVRDWLPDDPYPQADIDTWPDEPGEVVPSDMMALEDEIWSLLGDIAAAREFRLPDRGEVFDALPVADGPRLYALAARVPIGPADKYAVLAAPGPVQRIAALRDAVETIAALIAFETGSGPRPPGADE